MAWSYEEREIAVVTGVSSLLVVETRAHTALVQGIVQVKRCIDSAFSSSKRTGQHVSENDYHSQLVHG